MMSDRREHRMLVVSAATFDELRQKLIDAGYDWSLNERQDMLKMGEFVLIEHEDWLRHG